MLVQQSYQIQQLDHVPVSLLEDMLTLIRNTLRLGDDDQNIVPRSKFILTELISNAIKHSNATLSDIKIQLSDTFLKIIKTDKGNRLKVPQIKDSNIKDGDLITTDIMHTLYSVTDNNRMHFYCFENDEPFFGDENNYPEHFGLLIITKSSDEFYYSYDHADHTNTFSATINL